MYQMDLNPYYSLKFPNAGNYVIKGNLNGTIVPVAGVYVERQTSLAYATTAVGGSGPTAAEIAAAVLAAAQLTPIHSDLRKAIGQAYHGDGSEGNKLRSTLVP